ncbi:MAG: hypothetical protein HYT27_00055 [Parcubacteria group bacterium]|nr:hypothetical protein [Parcubacteria group bacterium]
MKTLKPILFRTLILGALLTTTLILYPKDTKSYTSNVVISPSVEIIIEQKKLSDPKFKYLPSVEEAQALEFNMVRYAKTTGLNHRLFPIMQTGKYFEPGFTAGFSRGPEANLIWYVQEWHIAQNSPNPLYPWEVDVWTFSIGEVVNPKKAFPVITFEKVFYNKAYFHIPSKNPETITEPSHPLWQKTLAMSQLSWQLLCREYPCYMAPSAP